MKSSSELFPVTLSRAELLGSYADDIYLVKHNTDTDKTVQVAVSHLSPVVGAERPQAGSAQPVVLVHGAFQNRNQWLGMQGEGLAGWLVDQGFDVWLMEMRGHGYSPRNRDYQRNTAESCACYDVPAVNAFVQEQTGRKPVWIGHSLGGLAVATAVAATLLTPENCAGTVLLGTQVLKRPWYMWLPLTGVSLRTMMKIKGELDGQKAGMGPENEPVGVVNEYLRRQGLFGKWQLREQKRLLLPGWRAARLPLLMVSGGADEMAPADACQRFFDLYGSLADATPDISVVSDAPQGDETDIEPALNTVVGEREADSGDVPGLSADQTPMVDSPLDIGSDLVTNGAGEVSGDVSGEVSGEADKTDDVLNPVQQPDVAGHAHSVSAHLIMAVAHGASMDFDSGALAEGEPAQVELWPRIKHWLDALAHQS